MEIPTSCSGHLLPYTSARELLPHRSGSNFCSTDYNNIPDLFGMCRLCFGNGNRVDKRRSLWEMEPLHENRRGTGVQDAVV